MSKQTRWFFIIDADSYSGYFDDKIGAYITGHENLSLGDNLFVEFQETFGYDPNQSPCDWDSFKGNPFRDLFCVKNLGKISEIAVSCIRPGTGDYQSVQFEMYKEPTEVQIKLLKTWVHKFVAKTNEGKYNVLEEMKKGSTPFAYIPPLNILGMRLVREEIETTRTEISL